MIPVNRRTTRPDDWSARRGSGAQLRRGIRTTLSALSFWSAVLLPLVYGPVLLHGPETPDEVLVFLGLVGFHLVALVGGRNYDPPQRSGGI